MPKSFALDYAIISLGSLLPSGKYEHTENLLLETPIGCSPVIDTDPLLFLANAWNRLESTPPPTPEGPSGSTHAWVNVLLDQCSLDDDQP